VCQVMKTSLVGDSYVSAHIHCNTLQHTPTHCNNTIVYEVIVLVSGHFSFSKRALFSGGDFLYEVDVLVWDRDPPKKRRIAFHAFPFMRRIVYSHCFLFEF